MSHPLEAVVGRRYGPVDTASAATAVADLVTATGDDPSRWGDHAPPSFAATALFRVAPDFLGDDDVATFTRSLIHTEQRFVWHGALPIDAPLAVAGEVTGVRGRGGLNLVTFDLTVDASGERWLDGAATFLMSEEPASEADDEPEPPHDERAAVDTAEASPLPAAGTALPVMQRSASRADLVRYAAATGDFNPIHWDHAAARAAGLPGVIVHGLLMAAWTMQAAARHAPGPAPLQSLRLRFRRPLRPAAQASVGGSVTDIDEQGADLALSVTAGDDTLVSASARVDVSP